RRLVERAQRFVRERHAAYDVTLCASRVVERRLAAWGVPRVVCVGLGVDVELFRPGRGEARLGGPPALVYAGRPSSGKSFPLVLEAYDAIAAATGARLAIIGDGPGRRAAERFAASRPGVTVRGYVDSPAALAAALASADVALTPGARET